MASVLQSLSPPSLLFVTTTVHIYSSTLPEDLGQIEGHPKDFFGNLFTPPLRTPPDKTRHCATEIPFRTSHFLIGSRHARCAQKPILPRPRCAQCNWPPEKQFLSTIFINTMKTQRNKALQSVLPLATLVLGASIIHSAQAASWDASGSLGTARYFHTATLLPGGKVLAVGGKAASGITNRVELYNPASGTWTPANSLNTARYIHTATLLPSGKVLVTGGEGPSGFTRTAELYDPSTGTWTVTSPMTTNRAGHTATLLPNGKVLVAGGSASSGLLFDLSSTELYDPAAGTWTSTGPLNIARGYHKAVLLPSGQVLVAGGADSGFNCLSSAELFDPTTGKWTMTTAMKSARAGFAAVLLANGKVLAAGGQIVFDTPVRTAELFDPATGTWTWTTAMGIERADNTAILLPNGSALLVDGWDNQADAPTSELYNPTSGTWSAAATFNSPRFHVTATLLPNGMVLATGGLDSHHSIFSTTQLYDTGSGPIVPPNVTATKATPNAPLQLSFSGRLGSVFTVIATENVGVPVISWPVIGVATESPLGQYQFTDLQATNFARRFYRVRSP